jgi:hypothetical protein
MIPNADPDIMAAIYLLEQEIDRDTDFIAGDITPEALDKFRARLGDDLEAKNKALEKLSGKSGINAATELISKSADAEKDIAASKSKTHEKRRQAQRQVASNLRLKKDALSVLRKKIAE